MDKVMCGFRLFNIPMIWVLRILVDTCVEIEHVEYLFYAHYSTMHML